MPDKVALSKSDPAQGSSDEWPSQATDLVVRTVGTVRDKTMGPAVTVARALVFGLFAAVAGVAAAVLFSVGLVRLITVYMPDERVWAAQAIVGGVFMLGALVLWAKAKAKPRTA